MKANSSESVAKPEQAGDVTKLLLAWNRGNPDALDSLMPLIYNDLRRLARRSMRAESPGNSLQATALVNEAYIRLVDQKRVNWCNRGQFFAVAAQIIRRILVDHFRAGHRQKRGGGAIKVMWDEENKAAEPATIDIDIVALDDALQRLSTFDSQGSRIVELRFFAGLSIEETAEVLNVSISKVKRDWVCARLWLYREMKSH